MESSGKASINMAMLQNTHCGLLQWVTVFDGVAEKDGEGNK